MLNLLSRRAGLSGPGFNRLHLFVMAVLVIYAATANAEKGKLEKEVERCAAEHSYDRGNTANLGQHQLAPTERVYLDCVYEGMNKRVIPKALLPDDYRKLISSYKQMTDAVEKGELTRAERTTHAKEKLEAIWAKESVEREKRIQELDSMRSNMQRQMEMMKRTNVPRIF
ncbi:MAG: hypothetical protein EP297_13160 [Gammaproteobacteria bacterium]|nr:MAG: hypothetical protein EP297_13160 [Gammaproteobacteria bacterium]